MAQEKFSGLDAVVTPALTDITAVVQAAEVNVKNRKTTWQQVFNLFRSAGQSISDPDYVVNLTQDNQTLFYENSSAANWTLPLLTIGDVNKILYIKNSSVHQLALASVSPVDNSSGASLASFEARIFKIFFTEGAFRYQTIASFVTELPVSSGGTGAQSAAAALINLGAEASANKNEPNGYPGLDDYDIELLSSDGSGIISRLRNFNTATRDYEFPDNAGFVNISIAGSITGSGTLTQDHMWKTNLCSSASAIALTIPSDSGGIRSDAQTKFIWTGVGQVSFTIGASATVYCGSLGGALTSASGITPKIAFVGGGAYLEKVASNTYWLSGDLTS